MKTIRAIEVEEGMLLVGMGEVSSVTSLAPFAASYEGDDLVYLRSRIVIRVNDDTASYIMDDNDLVYVED